MDLPHHPRFHILEAIKCPSRRSLCVSLREEMVLWTIFQCWNGMEWHVPMEINHSIFGWLNIETFRFQCRERFMIYDNQALEKCLYTQTYRFAVHCTQKAGKKITTSQAHPDQCMSMLEFESKPCFHALLSYICVYIHNIVCSYTCIHSLVI